MKMSTFFVFQVILVMVSGVLGIIGNILLIKLFMYSEVKLNFHKLMITLAIYDTINVSLCILVFSIPELFEAYISSGVYAYVVPKAIPMIQVALTGSVYCTVAISLERYLTVCHPFYVTTKRWSEKRYIIPIILFSILYNLPHFLELTTECSDFKNEISLNSTNFTETYSKIYISDYLLNTNLSLLPVMLMFA